MRPWETMKAHEEGAEVEAFVHGEWLETEDPVWNWDDYQYRIKPQAKKRLRTILELWGRTLVDQEDRIFTVCEAKLDEIFCPFADCTLSIESLHYDKVRVAPEDENGRVTSLDYGDCESLEVEETEQ